MSTTLDKKNGWLTCNGLLTDHSLSLEDAWFLIIENDTILAFPRATITDEIRERFMTEVKRVV